jgi:hypothetical protein
MAGPLVGDVGDLRAPTINTRNVNGGALGGDATDPGAATINAKKH